MKHFLVMQYLHIVRSLLLSEPITVPAVWPLKYELKWNSVGVKNQCAKNCFQILLSMWERNMMAVWMHGISRQLWRSGRPLSPPLSLHWACIGRRQPVVREIPLINYQWPKISSDWFIVKTNVCQVVFFSLKSKGSFLMILYNDTSSHWPWIIWAVTLTALLLDFSFRCGSVSTWSSSICVPGHWPL